MQQCELAQRAGTGKSVFPEHYYMLHEDGRTLMHDWYQRGKSASTADLFEPFIFLWIAFNAWASCVTGEDADRSWLEALETDTEMNRTFDRLKLDPNSALAGESQALGALWPIFKVEELRALGVNYWTGTQGSRAETTAHFIEMGARQYQPRCWASHIQAGEMPVDWPHTLEALYRVRCNLFHGEKARSSENDREVMRAAHGVLLIILQDGGCFPDVD